MSAFCEASDLGNESDVEQKLILPLLRQPVPIGFGFEVAEIKSKPDIRRLEVGKGETRKLYYPDFIIVLSGLPVLVVEAKGPAEEISTARREARLYASELNALFPAFDNPCAYTMVSNGITTSVQAWDSDEPLASVSLAEADASNPNFSRLVEILCAPALHKFARNKLVSLQRKYFRPLNLVGGQSVRNEEIAENSFGTSLVLNFKHIFNPLTREDRAFIVHNAYIASKRRDRYIQQIDRVIRAAAPPSVRDATLIEDTSRPAELTSQFQQLKRLERQTLLLIGAVGAGKSTFVDYLKEVALSESEKLQTSWVRLDLNAAPLYKEGIYVWITNELRSRIREIVPDQDFDSLEMLQKLFAPDVQRLRKGALSLLEPSSSEYKTRLVDEILRLQNDSLKTVQALERYLCTERGKLLIVVLDNSDKRGRDEQLLMFEVAQWLQSTLRCLIVLPLRDVTYDNHRDEPPLDTALKDLVFRIEPPNFQRVLHARVQLALKEMQKGQASQMLFYELSNGMRVEYPSSQLGMFLASIMRSIYEHDAFVRRMVTGIAGRDIRRAIEIFLEFCTSGHIEEGEIFKIMAMKGQHSLPHYVVANILLRMNRRYYDGDHSYVKNLFQCFPSDQKPDHFTRYRILQWLHSKMAERGPNGARGYHQAGTLLRALTAIGVEPRRGLEEILYLVQASCVIPEHQLSNSISPEDLISISPAGYVHLDLVKDVNYLAACAEDNWYASEHSAVSVQKRIMHKHQHFTRWTTLQNAGQIVDYLKSCSATVNPDTKLYLHDPEFLDLDFERSLKFIDEQLAKM